MPIIVININLVCKPVYELGGAIVKFCLDLGMVVIKQYGNNNYVVDEHVTRRVNK